MLKVGWPTANVNHEDNEARRTKSGFQIRFPCGPLCAGILIDVKR